MKHKSMAVAKEKQADAMIPRYPGLLPNAGQRSNSVRLPRAGLILPEITRTARTFIWVIVLLRRCKY